MNMFEGIKMKISALSQTSISFRRALTSKEEKQFSDVTTRAMQTLGIDDGVRLFKIFSTALPSKEDENTGSGKINSPKAQEYLDFISLYTGSNAVKIYPIGQMPTQLRHPNYYCPYERMGITVGEDNINFKNLEGVLLSKEDIEEFIVPNSPRCDFENEFEPTTGAIPQLIKKAYCNLDLPQAQAIKEDFLRFKEQQKSDTLDRLAIVPFIRETDPELFKDFSTSPDKQTRFEEYKKQYGEEIELYKFGKFLAQNELKNAKENLNKKGIELFGDCPIGFSADEVFCFPDAFFPKNISAGWNFRAIKYDDVLEDGTEANRLFKEKISTHLELFDGIRFDVGWQYFGTQLKKIDSEGNEETISLDIQDKLVKFIEKTAKEIKGEDYNTKKLMYEWDVGGDSIQIFDWSTGKPIPNSFVKGRTPVVTSVYEHVDGSGWGNPQFINSTGLDSYMIGTNNHDSTPLRILAEQDFDDNGLHVSDLKEIREDNIGALEKSMNVTREWLQNPKNFIKAKFAELFQSKNHFLFFNDVIGNDKRLDEESSNPENYRFRIDSDYERQYHTALQDGYGFNLAESLAMAMKAKGLNETHNKLYSQVKEFADILYSVGAKTKEEAEKSSN